MDIYRAKILVEAQNVEPMKNALCDYYGMENSIDIKEAFEEHGVLVDVSNGCIVGITLDYPMELRQLYEIIDIFEPYLESGSYMVIVDDSEWFPEYKQLYFSDGKRTEYYADLLFKGSPVETVDA